MSAATLADSIPASACIDGRVANIRHQLSLPGHLGSVNFSNGKLSTVSGVSVDRLIQWIHEVNSETSTFNLIGGIKIVVPKCSSIIILSDIMDESLHLSQIKGVRTTTYPDNRICHHILMKGGLTNKALKAMELPKIHFMEPSNLRYSPSMIEILNVIESVYGKPVKFPLTSAKVKMVWLIH